VFLAIADEWLEKFASNRLRDATAIVRETNLQSPKDLSQIDIDLSVLSCDRLTGVQQQIVKSAFQFLGVEPTRAVALLPDRNANVVKVGVGTHGLYHAFDRFLYAAICPPQGFPGARELQQRIDQIRHLINCDPNLLVQLLPLIG